MVVVHVELVYSCRCRIAKCWPNGIMPLQGAVAVLLSASMAGC